MTFAALADQALAILVWGLVASMVMAAVLEGSQYFGFSRLSLPFLFGTAVTRNRGRAMVLGFVLYTLGGLLFSLVYFLIFADLGGASWWQGALFGAIHGLVLLIVFLPLLPYVHPQMATEFDGPAAVPRIEPPGVFGMYYGRRTPLITMIGQICYGAILGAGFSIPG